MQLWKIVLDLLRYFSNSILWAAGCLWTKEEASTLFQDFQRVNRLQPLNDAFHNTENFFAVQNLSSTNWKVLLDDNLFLFGSCSFHHSQF